MANEINDNNQWIRKTSLLLIKGEKALDVSELRFTFQTTQADEESPSTCAIRVYNMAPDTIKKVRGEYSSVVLQAGYEGSPGKPGSSFGQIFVGTIRQFRIGKEPDGISTYLDILAADGDISYNFAMVNSSMSAGTSARERVAAAVKAMSDYGGVTMGKMMIPDSGGILPRGKVLFGMARAVIRSEARTQHMSWTITDGKVNIVPLNGYLPTEAVVLTADTGLIGRVEQTEEGMRCRCLLNPRIVVGGLLKIDNKSINQTTPAAGQEIDGGQLPYNKWAGLQRFANVNDDGLYRVYVAEHNGDTRGNAYYTDIIALSVDPVTKKVKEYG